MNIKPYIALIPIVAKHYSSKAAKWAMERPNPMTEENWDKVQTTIKSVVDKLPKCKRM